MHACMLLRVLSHTKFRPHTWQTPGERGADVPSSLLFRTSVCCLSLAWTLSAFIAGVLKRSPTRLDSLQRKPFSSVSLLYFLQAIMEEVPEYILKSASTKDTSPTAYRLLPSKQTVQSYIGTARGNHVSLAMITLFLFPSNRIGDYEGRFLSFFSCQKSGREVRGMTPSAM